MATPGASPPRAEPSDSVTLYHSSFFRENRASALPPPHVVRALNKTADDPYAASFNRPPPVRIPSLGLLVKYGGDVTVQEAETQVMVRARVGGRVPVPEVFGWATEGRQVFIYMQLVRGDTLQARWEGLGEAGRRAVCGQMRRMVESWRGLAWDGGEGYVGSVGGRPLNDIFLQKRPELVGPFRGRDAVKEFQEACGIDVAGQTSVVFAHADLVGPNVLLSAEEPAVVAVVDWAQAGWYPDYWEYCKARRVQLDTGCMSAEAQDEWRAKYLPLVVDAVDDETCYHPWLQFVLSKGI